MKRVEILTHEDVLSFRYFNVNYSPNHRTLTQRERKILQTISRFQRKMHGAYGPTYAEIVEQSGHTASEVQTTVHHLIQNGNLIKPYGKHRCFMIVRET